MNDKLTRLQTEYHFEMTWWMHVGMDVHCDANYANNPWVL
jgi:hypothetical protein